MPAVAVLDTNVLISAVGWRGNPYRCLGLVRAGVVEAVICQEILDELAEKLEAKLAFSPSDTVETLAELVSLMRMVSIPGTLKVVAADPDDDKVLECATVGDATHVVTGDRRHLLPLGNYQGIRIVTPADFLAEVAAEGKRHDG